MQKLLIGYFVYHIILRYPSQFLVFCFLPLLSNLFITRHFLTHSIKADKAEMKALQQNKKKVKQVEIIL